jgi:hypothetical protein
VSYEEKIQRGLKLYLREVHHVKGNIISASLSEYGGGGDGGCDTCGYGSSERNFDIDYRVEGEHGSWKNIEMDPLDFFAVILPYIDRAN